MKLNWKVRLKNKVFWVSFVPTFFASIYTVLAMLEITPPISENAVTNLVMMVVSMLASIGVLVDPTTAGVGDSSLAMTYDEPRSEK